MINLTQLIPASTSASQLIPKISHDIFNWHSITVLVVALFIAWLIGRIAATIIYHISAAIGMRADRTQNLAKVNRLRRWETILILAMALIRTLLFIIALYVWWALTHPTQLTAIIGASALLLLMLTNLSSPIFRDLALGGGMIAEKWYGVGDLITLWPNNIQGIVEHVTLRSTKVRTINGELVWVANQNIAMVEVIPKGVHPIAIELFVSSQEKAEKLIESANKLLPLGTSMVIRPLAIMGAEEVDENTWHLTAIAEAAPWRDDLITTTAVQILKDLDQKSERPILLADPVSRAADSEAEKQFARVILNAKKRVRSRRLSDLASSRKQQEKSD